LGVVDAVEEHDYNKIATKAEERPVLQDDEMFTAQEVAQIMKVSLKTVRTWVQEGKLATIPIGKKEYRISRNDLNAFIAEQRKLRTPNISADGSD
jgi:excisionase family DNA binding protein